jgi:hypothetical protein
MFAFEWLPLIVKALVTALIVMSASAVADALGPVWGAIVASLPVSAGPAYVFLAMQHGPDFVAASVLNSAAANAGTGLFLITYAVLAKRIPPWRSLAVAVALWLAICLLQQRVAWNFEKVCELNLAVYGSGLFFVNKGGTARFEPAQSSRRRWFELPLRASFVAAFVSLVVAISSVLGPTATGIAAVFPVSLISLFVILQPRLDGPSSKPSSQILSLITRLRAPVLIWQPGDHGRDGRHQGGDDAIDRQERRRRCPNRLAAEFEDQQAPGDREADQPNAALERLAALSRSLRTVSRIPKEPATMRPLWCSAFAARRGM